MSARILDAVRAKYPAYAKVPDDQLTLAIGRKYPVYLEDPDFRTVFEAREQQEGNTRDTSRATSVTGRVKDFVDLPGLKRAVTGGTAADWGRAAGEGASQAVQSATAPVRAVADVVGGAANKVGEMLAGDVRAVVRASSIKSPGFNLPGFQLDPEGPVAKGLEEGARAIPIIAGSLALQRAGIPAPVAFGAPAAAATYAETGDVGAAARSASIAAVIPGVVRAGNEATGVMVKKLVERGLVPAGATTAQKAAEALGGQGAVQVFLEGMNLPEYAQMSPEERRETILRNMVANTAFLAMDVPGVVGRGPSSAQRRGAGLSAELRSALKDFANDPEMVIALEHAADQAVLDAARPKPSVVIERPIPEGEATIRAQLTATADPASTKAATLLVPGSPAPELPPGLDAMRTQHGWVIYNPEKIGPDAVKVAAAGPQFDGRVLGMSQAAKPEVPNPVAVTTRAADGSPEVVGELVAPDPAAVRAAATAQARAVPDGTVEVRRPEEVLAERQATPENPVAAEPGSATTPADTAGAGAETITGARHERTGSEIPAEREERPNPPRRTSRKTERVFGEERPRDLIDEIQDAFGKISLKEIRRLEPNFKPTGAARKLFAAESGHPADVVAEAMSRSGIYKGDPARVGDFAYAILDAAEARKGNRKASAQEGKEIRELAKQHETFQAKVVDGKRPKRELANVEQVSVDSLVEGDQFTVQGQKFRVQEMEWDPDTLDLVSVTLKDGPKFGVQRLAGSDAEVIHIDKESFKPKAGSRSTEFLSPEDAAPEPAAAAEPFGLEAVTKEQLDAEAARKAAAEKAAAVRAEIETRAAAPLTGSSAEVGQGKLFAGDSDLFSGPSGQDLVGKGSSRTANMAPFAEGIPPLPGAVPTLDMVRPVYLPEMVRLTRALLGDLPAAKTKLGQARGVFTSKEGGPGRIALLRSLFETGQLEQAAKTLAHEIGHAVDFMPERTLRRGNLLGRLLSLREFLKGTFGGVSVTNKELRSELESVSWWWRPFDPATASKSELQYRKSGKELYADALSVLLNSPGELQKRAPKFYAEFFKSLDRKPTVKQALFDVQQILAKGSDAVQGARIEFDRNAYEKAEERLKQITAEQDAAYNSLSGIRARLLNEHLDIAEKFTRDVRTKGKPLPPWADPREAWERNLFADNRNYLDLDYISQNVVRPVEQSGADLNTLGLVLQYQRQIGDRLARGSLDDIRQTLGGRFELAKKAGTVLAKLERAGRNDEYIDEHLWQPLAQQGISQAAVLDIQRLLAEQGTRVDLANPGGLQAPFAEEALKFLLDGLPTEQREAVLRAADVFRNRFFERAKEGHRVGIYSDDVWKTIEANRDTYVAFQGLDHVDTWVSPMARRALGSLGEIGNPFHTTLYKLASLNSLVELQKAKIAARDFYKTEFPESFRPAEEYWDGARRTARAPKDGLARLEILEGGRRLPYDVDPSIAEAFEKLTPRDLSVIGRLIDVPFRNLIYPAIIKYNPAFQFWANPRRDKARTIRNLVALKKLTPGEFRKAYREARTDAEAFVRGDLTPLVQDMMTRAAIGMPMDSLGQLDRGDALGDLLRRYRLAPTPNEASGWLRKARDLAMTPLKAIERAGAIREALPKFAAYKAMTAKGVNADEAAVLVRNYVGTPNYRVKGRHGNVANVFVPFSNIFLQGYRMDARLATQPTTRGGWWMRWLLTDGWKSIATGAASSGLLGTVLKETYDGIPDYDKANYTVIPVGWMNGGEHGKKVIYVRLPRDEASRVLSAAAYSLARMAGGDLEAGKTLTHVADVGAGAVPTTNPMLRLAGAWKDYLRGVNPIDPWHNRAVVPARNWTAGGWDSLKPMMGWSLDQMGVGSFVSYNPHADSVTEMVVGGIPVLNRIVKISDYGYSQRQREAQDELQRAKAINKLEFSDDTKSLLQDFYRLQGIAKDRRTPEQERRFDELRAWHYRFERADADSREYQDQGKREEARRVRNAFDSQETPFTKKALKSPMGMP